MQKRTRLAYLLWAAGALPVMAQQSDIYVYPNRDFDKAVHLYHEKQYVSAQRLFERIAEETDQPSIKGDCAYYSANCAIRLEQPNADEKMTYFVTNYPTSSKQNQAYLEVAQYYFSQGRYPQALTWFDKVDESSLNRSQLAKYNFQQGYAYFTAGKKKDATKHFNAVVNDSEWGSQAKYYLGHLAYESDDYKEASRYFDEVSGEEKYKEQLSYFQADMHFKLGDFEKAIQLGKAAMAKSNATEKSELNKIIGESYFNLKQYDQALPYLKEYRGKKGKWSNTDYYQLGYTYYQQKDYANAVAQFNKIVGSNDAVAQNAYYHLGESYLKLDQKQQAFQAFKTASEMDFDTKIQEDAHLNYAKLSYEIGNSYLPAPEVLAGFLKKYPNTPARTEVEGLLIDSYITSKNYEGALSLLEKNKSTHRDALQKVSFYRGLELYSDGDYNGALNLFTQSINNPVDATYKARALFWKGESEYTLDRFNDAQLSLKQYLQTEEAKRTPEYANAYYHLGYAYFKQKEYALAGDALDQYIQANPKDKARLNDAYLRLGDARFVDGKYWPAMEAYNKAIEMKGVDADYAAYQKGISYGFVNRNDRKIEDLNLFLKNFTKSQYRDDALYELGNTYVAVNQNTEALKTYDQLVREFPTSTYAAKAMLRQGMVHYNAEKDALALDKFKQLTTQYPGTPEAVEAVGTARLIHQDRGTMDEFAAWVKTLNFYEISDAELDKDMYASAEKMYLQNKSKEAISGFTKYLAQFPSGSSALKANFYLGQLYFQDNLMPQAKKHYEYVASKAKSEFTEQAMARIAEINLKGTDTAASIASLKALEQNADYPQNITFAQANLMRLYYETEDYSQAVVYADKMLAQSKIDPKVKSDAQIIVARSAWHSGDKAKAKKAYADLAKTAQGEVAAEALYYDAYFKNADKQYEASNAVVQKLAKDYGSYKYWGAQGLVLMARNYLGLKDYFQANYILESVLKNFKQYEDVIAEANLALEAVQVEAAQTNSSLTR